MNVPAQCLKCGAAFTENSIIIENSEDISISGNSRCPKCGGPARMVEGSFDYTDRVSRINYAPEWSRDVIDRLQIIVEKAKKSDVSADDILAEVAGISPDLARTLRKKGLPAFVIIIVLIWFIKGVSIDVKIDLNKTIDQAYTIYKDSQLHETEIQGLPDPDFQKLAPDEPIYEFRRTTAAGTMPQSPNRKTRRQELARRRRSRKKRL